MFYRKPSRLTWFIIPKTRLTFYHIYNSSVDLFFDSFFSTRLTVVTCELHLLDNIVQYEPAILKQIHNEAAQEETFVSCGKKVEVFRGSQTPAGGWR